MSEPSIRLVKTDTDALARQAQGCWNGLANRLGKLIPDHLIMFARKVGWVKLTGAGLNDQDIADRWKFPDFLKLMAEQTHGGSYGTIRCRNGTDLQARWGFINLEDMKTQMKVLAAAWEGHIDINVLCDDESETCLIEVQLRATELIPEEGDTNES
jgi:hypothetical protein